MRIMKQNNAKIDITKNKPYNITCNSSEFLNTTSNLFKRTTTRHK